MCSRRLHQDRACRAEIRLPGHVNAGRRLKRTGQSDALALVELDQSHGPHADKAGDVRGNPECAARNGHGGEFGAFLPLTLIEPASRDGMRPVIWLPL